MFPSSYFINKTRFQESIRINNPKYKNKNKTDTIP